MNVYSVQFFPKLKIKFCQYFGIASTLAVEELDRRAIRIENRISQLHRFLKLQAKKKKAKPAEKKADKKVIASPKPKAVSKSKTKIKSKSKTKRPSLATITDLPLLSTRPILVEKPVEEIEVPIQKTTPAPQPVVKAPEEVIVLIQPEDETRRAAQGYFGSEVTLIELENLQHLEGHFDGKKVLAVIFDRMLLSQEPALPVFEKLNQQFPSTKMIGLSHYLTLALSESFSNRNDFATFTSRPLSSEGLAEIFGGKPKQAIS